MSENLEQQLDRAVRARTPDVWERINTATETQERGIVPMTTIAKKKTGRIIAWIAAAAAAVALVTTGGIGYTQFLAEDTLIEIDVNPSIELAVNKRDRVLRVDALNEDAQVILEGMELKNTDVNTAVNAIIGSMVRKGYLVDDTSTVLVSVDNKDETKAAALRDNISICVQKMLQEENRQVKVIRQEYSKKNGIQSDVEALAEQYAIPYGKAQFISRLIAAHPELTAEQLAPMTMSDITKLMKEKGYKLSDIAGCDDDDICDVCGKLESECGDCDDRYDDDDDDICDVCGKPESECGDCDDRYDDDDDDICDVCGKPESECGDCDDRYDDDDDDICDVCGKPESVCGDCDDRDEDDDDFCENCGKPENQCKGTCVSHTGNGQQHGKDKFCDDCGKRESVCRGQCDDD